MKRTKMFSVVLVLLMLVGSLVSCTSTPDAQEPEAVETPEVTEEVVEVEATPEPPTKYTGQIRIAISMDQTPATEAAKAKLTAAYKEVQPDVELIWEEKPSASYNTWLGTQLASDSEIDIVSGVYQASYNSYVDFNMYKDTRNTYTGNKWSDDFEFGTNPVVNGKGELIQLAPQMLHVGWYYNKEIFDEVGVVPPANWDEFVEVCEKIDAAGYIPVTANYTYKIPNWLAKSYMDQYPAFRGIIDYARPLEGDWNYDYDLDGNFEMDFEDKNIQTKATVSMQRFYYNIKEGNVTYNNESMVDFVTQFSRIFPTYANEDLFVISDDYPLFVQQESAIYLDISKALFKLQADADFEWGTFEHPPFTTDLASLPIRTPESTAGEYVSVVDRNQEQTEMVLDFVKFWFSAPGYQAWMDGMDESTIGIQISGPLLVNNVVLPDEVMNIISDIPTMGNCSYPINSALGQVVGGGRGFAVQARDLFASALKGDITAEEFAAQYQAIIDDNFETIIDAHGFTLSDIENPEIQPQD